ncbi:MAG: FAD:protein FMN transferase [Syntrophaceae bacterium]|nr:FAD:protein FMN transferase [Syntrophaceae bacterium]
MGGNFRIPHSPFRFPLLFGFILLLVLPSLLLAQDPRLLRQSRILMGTSVEITVSQVDPKRAEASMEAAFQEVERLNRLMSHYRPDSEVSQITQNAGKKKVRVSPETLEVIERALYFSRLSEGAFDITIGPVFRLWNFREGKVPGEPVLKENLARVDYRKIKIDRASSAVGLEDPRMELDLGAIAKGYAVDRACEVLKGRGIGNFLVNAGGDLKVGGEKGKGFPWTIGIQHPRLPSQFISKLRPKDSAVATSGDYEKFFLKDGERYHHILVPSTGMPSRESQSVTILAPSAMDADALATAVFVLGPKKGFALIEKMTGVHAIIVDRRGSVLLSPNWPAGVLLPP